MAILIIFLLNARTFLPQGAPRSQAPEEAL